MRNHLTKIIESYIDASGNLVDSDLTQDDLGIVDEKIMSVVQKLVGDTIPLSVKRFYAWAIQRYKEISSGEDSNSDDLVFIFEIVNKSGLNQPHQLIAFLNTIGHIIDKVAEWFDDSNWKIIDADFKKFQHYVKQQNKQFIQEIIDEIQHEQ